MTKQEIITLLQKQDRYDVSDDCSNSDIYEILSCLEVMQTELYAESRWWNIVQAVAKVTNDIYISYPYYETTGDRTADELGAEPLSLKMIHQVYPQTVKTIVYTSNKSKV